MTSQQVYAGIHERARRYTDREHAGAALAEALAKYARPTTLVLGIPRGGVPVAAEIARRLGAELDVIVARKLGSPVSAELAIGAVTANGGRFLNEDVIRALSVSPAYVERITAVEREESRRREELFREGRARASLEGRTVILVDDGLATGSTMRAAIRAVRQGSPARLVVAIPVAPRETVAGLAREADEVVCPSQPEPFGAVGWYYDDFWPTADDEVVRLLRDRHVAGTDAGTPAASDQEHARAGLGARR